MKKISYEEAIAMAGKFTEQLEKEHKVDLKKDEFIAVLPLENHQAIIIHPENDEDGRHVNVDVTDSLYVANRVNHTALNIFDEG